MVRAWPDGAVHGTRQGELWITKRAVEYGLDTCPRRLGAEAALVGQLEVRLLQFLDVDVLESQHPHGLDKPGRAVHVPHPGVTHSQLEVHLTVRGTRLKVDIVSQVEPALGFHYVAELGDDVLVLAIELQLHVGLVVFEILSTHRTAPPHKRTCIPRKRSAISEGPRSSVARSASAPHENASRFRRDPGPRRCRARDARPFMLALACCGYSRDLLLRPG